MHVSVHVSSCECVCVQLCVCECVLVSVYVCLCVVCLIGKKSVYVFAQGLGWQANSIKKSSRLATQV